MEEKLPLNEYALKSQRKRLENQAEISLISFDEAMAQTRRLMAAEKNKTPPREIGTKT